MYVLHHCSPHVSWCLKLQQWEHTISCEVACIPQPSVVIAAAELFHTRSRHLLVSCISRWHGLIQAKRACVRAFCRRCIEASHKEWRPVCLCLLQKTETVHVWQAAWLFDRRGYLQYTAIAPLTALRLQTVPPKICRRRFAFHPCMLDSIQGAMGLAMRLPKEWAI